MSTSTRARIDRLTHQLQQRNWDAFLAWSDIAMGYLHGLFEHPHRRLMTLAVRKDGKTAMICPSLSASQAARSGISDIRSWQDHEDPIALFKNLVAEWGLENGTIAVDGDMPARMALSLQIAAPNARIVDGEDALGVIMRQKEADEIDLLRRAGRIADEALSSGIAALRIGATEHEIGAALSDAMRRLGGVPTFSIMGIGKNSAEPHHLNDDTALEANQIVLMDFGCTVQRYNSDITRVVCFGKATQKMKDVYKIVHEAHMAARDAIRPGVEAQEIDRAARRVIEKAGYGEKFFHRLGHGIGLNGHEPPYMLEGNRHLLEVGNAFSVEPGIYLEGEFGVRLENIVVVTENGHESMNQEISPDLIEIEA